MQVTTEFNQRLLLPAARSAADRDAEGGAARGRGEDEVTYAPEAQEQGAEATELQDLFLVHGAAPGLARLKVTEPRRTSPKGRIRNPQGSRQVRELCRAGP